MRWQDLAGPLASRGLDVLAGAIGGPAGPIVATIGREVARRVGVSTPEEVADALDANQDALIRVEQYEAENLDVLRDLAASQHELAMVETRSENFLQWAWRPMMSWQLIIMWFWNSMLLPIAVGITGTPIERIPYDQLLAYTGIWLTIYGGGNTIKSVLGRKS